MDGRRQGTEDKLSLAAQWTKRGSFVVATLVIAVCGVVLVGWVLQERVLTDLGAGVSMHPFTASCFILASLSLLLLQDEMRGRRHFLGSLCGAVVALAGLLVLVGYALEWERGIDGWLFPAVPEMVVEYTNRMAVATALGFLLLGLALAGLDTELRAGARVGQLLILGTALLSALMISGYAYQALDHFLFRTKNPMALNTALCFLLMSAGVLAARPNRGVMAVITDDDLGGYLARRLLPVVIFLPLAMGALRWWGERAGLYGSSEGIAYFTVATMVVLVGLIWLNALWLRWADRARRRPEQRLAVQYTVSRALAEQPTLEEGIEQILQSICETQGWQFGSMWEVHPRANSIDCVSVWHPSPALFGEMEKLTREATFPPRIELPGRVWAEGQPTWIPDLAKEYAAPRAPIALRAGLRSAFGFPIRRGLEVMGVMEFFSQHIPKPDDELREMFGAIGNQIGQFIRRRRSETALRDSQALYHSLVETLPVNILRKDAQGRVTFGNQRYAEIMGRPMEELLGKTDYDLFPKELATKYRADDEKVMQTEQVFDDIEQHQTPEGRRLYMHVIKAPVHDAHGKMVGTQTIFWDETARKTAEEDLRKTLEQLERSNRELEQFAYVASHDLQEPLRMVASYTQLLAKRYQDHLDQDAHDFIGFAVGGAVRMQRLIADLLTYSRVTQRGKPLELIDCAQVLEAALSHLREDVEQSRAEIHAGPLPTVRADPSQLAQLMQNLISNGLKFRGGAPPRIEVSAERRAGDWLFSFRDNGLGIEPRYHGRIFDIFQRLHTRDEYPGTGIGLALCKKIVERHGGRIWVESDLGRGSVFRFTLPSN
jgi:PAS domain S-box-containing protein